MARNVYLYDPPERFVVGTVGQPGERVFYLQARSGSRTTSVVLEKEQAELLAEKVLELLDEVSRRHPDVIGMAELAAVEDNDPLENPISEDSRVGSDEDAPDCLRVRLTASQARAFARRTERVVAAGRPPCPFCHLPLDPDGHICPRANGYRR